MQPREERPLRVAMLSEHASPVALLGSVDAGGQNTYVDEVSRRLGQLGLQVDVFTRRDDPDASEVIAWAPGVRVVNLAVGPARFVPKDDLWPLMRAFERELLRFAAGEDGRYDVLHGNFWMSGWIAARLRRRLHIPAVQIFHALGKTKQRHQGDADTSPGDRIEVETSVLKQVDRVIAQCPAERDELIHDYGAAPRAVTMIPSAVNVRRFRPIAREAARAHIGLPSDGPVVAYIGRMLPRKDPRNIVRAVALLANDPGFTAGREITLLCVGGETTDPDPVATPEIAQLQQLAADLGIGHHMRIVGKRQPDELSDYYCAADVVVTTPWYEPFGLTPLEAQACGRPVIGSAVGGITFTIADGVTGYLVPPRDPAAVARRLRDLLTQPDLRERMGRAARARVEREFTWETVGARTNDLYRTVIASTRGNAHSFQIPATALITPELLESTRGA